MSEKIAARSIATRVPQSVAEAVEAAAARTLTTPAAYLRGALAERLTREGFLRPAADTATSARR